MTARVVFEVAPGEAGQGLQLPPGLGAVQWGDARLPEVGDQMEYVRCWFTDELGPACILDPPEPAMTVWVSDARWRLNVFHTGVEQVLVVTLATVLPDLRRPGPGRRR